MVITMDESLLATHVLRVFPYEAPFDNGMEALAANTDAEGRGLDLATAETHADLRMRSPPDAFLNTIGARVNAAYVYLLGPDHANILVVSGKANPFVFKGEPAIATDSHRAGIEYFLIDSVTANLFEMASTDVTEARKTGVLLLQRREEKDIKTSYPLGTPGDIRAFANDSVPSFLFGSTAEEFGRFLYARGVRSVSHVVSPIDYVKSQGPRMARLVYLADVTTLAGQKSAIYGDGCGLTLGASGLQCGVRHEAVARPDYTRIQKARFTTASVPTNAR